jgi:hypothetical protein
LAEELQSREWRPSPKQEKFLALPDSIFEGLYGGAAGGGKSEVLLMLPVVRGWINHPRFKGLVLRRTFPELESELIPRADNYFPPTNGTYNQQKKCWSWPSGARLFFGHAEYERDIQKYDTAEYNYIGFDELTSFTEYQYKYLAGSRCRSSCKELPAIVRGGTNPGNVGHAWVKRHWRIGEIPQMTVIKDRVTNNLKIFIQSFLTDNPHLMENDPQYINRLELLPEKDKRAKKYGDWNLFEGQVFDDWREAPLCDEPPNACHVIPDAIIPDWWPKILAIDWGFTALTFALWGAISPDERLIVCREYAIRKAKISTWGSEIGKLSQGERYVDILMCRSAWQDRGDDKMIHQLFTDYSGLVPRKADNDRVGGKLMIQDYLRWKPKPIMKSPAQFYDGELAQRILRLNGLKAYDEYLESFRPEEPEVNIPKIQVMESCKILRDTIPLCIYDENNKEDVKEFDGDDPYDTLRYLVKGAENYIKSSVKEHEKRTNFAKIITQQQEQPDMNRFYMQMALHESKNKGGGAIRRYH